MSETPVPGWYEWDSYVFVVTKVKRELPRTMHYHWHHNKSEPEKWRTDVSAYPIFATMKPHTPSPELLLGYMKWLTAGGLDA